MKKTSSVEKGAAVFRPVWVLFPLAFLSMLPVTGVVPILKKLIYDFYDVGEIAVSSFMSINMVGAFLGAPFLGLLADKKRNHLNLLIICALIDAFLWVLLAFRPPFVLLMTLRFVEGVSHTGVMVMIMALMGHIAEGEGRRSMMAAMGGAIMFGIAAGSPIGGVLGRYGVLLPLQAGSVVMLIVAGVAVFLRLDQRVAGFFIDMGDMGDMGEMGEMGEMGDMGDMGGVMGHAKSRGSEIAPELEISGAGLNMRLLLGRFIGVKRLFSNSALRLPYLFAFVDRFTIGVFIIAFLMYATYLGHGPRETGFLIGAFMIPFAVLCYPIGKLAEKWGLWRFVLGGSLLFGVAYGAVPWFRGGWLWANMVVCGVLSAVMFGPNLMLVTRASSPSTRATAMAGFDAAGSLGFLVGPMVGGTLLQLLKGVGSQEFVFRLVFAVIGATEVLCVSWGLYRLRRK